MKYGISKMLAIGLMAAGLQAAKAESFVTTAATAHVTVPALTSQAQLARILREQGYGGILLADTQPSFTAPHPELNPERTAHPESTPVRAGWNGVAVKDGQRVDIYAGF
jgi:hypothetical protein